MTMRISPDIYPGLFLRMKPSFTNIIMSVSKAQGITVENLMSKDRRREYAEARFVAYKILRDSLGMTTVKTAQIFDRDHSSVVYGLKMASNLLSTNKDFRDKFQPIINQYK